MAQNDIKVSVIVVAYNQEDTIARCLDSILSQRCSFNYEIVIGEDCSSDRTREICRDYASRYPDKIVLIENKSNKGVLTNYYDCLDKCRGEYVADLGGDDYWIDNFKLQDQAELLDSDPDTVLVHTDWKCFLEERRSFRSPWKDSYYPYSHIAEKGEITEKLLAHTKPLVVHLATSMYRRKTFLEMREADPHLFSNKDFQVEDFQLLVMMSAYGRVRFIDRVTLVYTVSDKSLTGNTDFKHTFDLYYGVMELNRYLEKKLGVEHSALMPTYKRYYHYLVMQSFHSMDDVRMDKIVKAKESWEVSPSLKSKIILMISKNKKVWAVVRKLWQPLSRRKKVNEG